MTMTQIFVQIAAAKSYPGTVVKPAEISIVLTPVFVTIVAKTWATHIGIIKETSTENKA